MPANAEEAKDTHWQVSTSLNQLRHFYRPWSVSSLCQSLFFYCICPQPVCPISESLGTDFTRIEGTLLSRHHSDPIYMACCKRVFCLIVNSLVTFLFFSSTLIFSSNHVSTMRCLVCPWWAFQHSRLCFTTASISSMSLSLHVIVIKAGTHFPYRPTLMPSVAQIPRQ